jgi:hypothetical protein
MISVRLGMVDYFGVILAQVSLRATILDGLSEFLCVHLSL